MDPLEAHRRAQDAFAAVLANVSPDQRSAPTPCAEWTVTDLIDHVLDGNDRVARGFNAEQPAERPADLVEAHRAGADAAQRAFAAPGSLDRVFELPFGQIPGRVLIVMRTTDLLTHAWDLAVATGQSTDVDPELAVRQLGLAREGLRPEFRGPGRFFGDEQPCPPGYPPAAQLAAFLGRTVPEAAD